jgi:hypothetical protein
MKKQKKSKARMVPSAQPGINSQRVGSQTPAQRAPNGGPPIEGDASDRMAKRSTDSLFGTQQPGYAEPDGLEVDANLARINRRAAEAYQSGRLGTRIPLPPESDGLGLPTDANLARANARAAAQGNPAIAQVAALDKALGEVDRALAKVRAGRSADQYSRIERLKKARAAVVQARDLILAKSGRDSAGTDPDFRARASAESSVPGIGRAAAMISKLQNR